MILNEPTKFWKLWKEDLKVSFPKRKLTNALQERWNIAHPNVLARLKQEKFMNMTSDIQFMYEQFGIGFTIEKGFYFDEDKYVNIQESSLKRRANKLGLSK
jgi:hypothetical protein